MNIIVCGAGKIGAHAAGVLALEGANVTVVDNNQSALDALSETLDVALVFGKPTDANALTGEFTAPTKFTNPLL